MTIPTEIPPAGYLPPAITLRGNADGAGNCTLKSQPVPNDRRWRVAYIVLTADSATITAGNVFIDDPDDLANLLDGTDDTLAVAEYTRGRVIEAGQTIVATWAGLAAGAACSARIEYDAERTD